MDQKQSKKCPLCGTTYFRQPLHTDRSWSIKHYCGEDCRRTISLVRQAMKTGLFKRAYAIVAQEIINSKKQI